MNSSVLKKSVMAAAVAGALSATATAPAQAQILNFSWTGVFTMLNNAGAAVSNAPSDWAAGYYGIAGAAHGVTTAFGWYGNRTPVSGTMSFDTSTGAGVGTVVPFTFFGDTTNDVASALGMSFQTADTIGTVVGTMLFSWNGDGHPVSIVLNGSGLFGAMQGGAFATGPTSTVSGVGALGASDGFDFDATMGVKTFPLGPVPMATMTTNTAACAGLAITQNNGTSITTTAAFTSCFPLNTADTVGGSPIPTGSFANFNPNFDVTSIHLDSVVVPVPAAVWLFGSGLVGLVGIARRKKKSAA